jgi:hypothetical protein
VYPFPPSNGLIILLLSLPPIQRLVNRLPQQWADYLNNATFTNHWKVKGRFAMTQGGGPGAFISVSSAKIVVWVTNAEWANEVLGSKNMFPKPAKAYEIMKLHGPNILTVSASQSISRLYPAELSVAFGFGFWFLKASFPFQAFLKTKAKDIFVKIQMLTSPSSPKAPNSPTTKNMPSPPSVNATTP